MKVFYLFVLCSLYLTFVLVAADFQLTGASTNANAKELGREEFHVSPSPKSREPLADSKTTTPHDTSVLDVALVLGCVGTVNQDRVCDLLAEFLQDVIPAMPMTPYLVVCW
jgi:hypothetical protein